MSYRIEEIDKNFASVKIGDRDFVFFDARSPHFKIYGLYEPYGDGPFKRLPKIDGVHFGVNMLSTNTAGGKLRIRTDSSAVAIRVEMESVCHMAHMTLLGSCGFDLYGLENGKEQFIKSFIPPGGICHGQLSYECFTDLNTRKMRDLTLYFPLYNGVKKLDIGLEAGSVIEESSPFVLDRPVVYYGSSITQGGCASRPGNAYPALITHATNIDHINLGFSGSCTGEIEMAEYISTIPMSAFVLDYDYNADCAEYLKDTHAPFYKHLRKKCPNLPIVIVSAPIYIGGSFTVERRDIVKATYDNAIAEGDNNVYFIDGSHLFDGTFSDACTVDGAHPNDLGFFRMAEGILPTLRQALKML